LDAVGRAHVDHEVDAVLVLDHRVLARDVGILEREIARLLSAADDETVLRDGDLLTLIDDAERGGRRAERSVEATAAHSSMSLIGERGHRRSATTAMRDRRRRAARRARRLRTTLRAGAAHSAAH